MITPVDEMVDILKKVSGTMASYPTCTYSFADSSEIIDQEEISPHAISFIRKGLGYYSSGIYAILAHHYKLPICTETAVYISAYEYYGTWKQAIEAAEEILYLDEHINDIKDTYEVTSLYQVHDRFGPEVAIDRVEQWINDLT